MADPTEAVRDGVAAGVPALRIAALVKQIPAFEAMRLGADGRLVRDGLPLEMSAYCRRAVAQGVALARATGGTCTVLTLGPPPARDVLLEALAFGADDALHLCDEAFAGSDTLATARALAAALEAHGPWDLVLAGQASVDADTGQVGPQVAELLDLPFASSVRHLRLERRHEATVARAGLEHDDLWLEVAVQLPAVLSTAERLIDPCKIKDPARWTDVDPARVRTVGAGELGPGPWGADGSPTWVGEVRTEAVERQRLRWDGDVADQVDRAVAWLVDHGALAPAPSAPEPPAPDRTDPPGRRGEAGAGPLVVALCEAGRPRLGRELEGAARQLAARLGGRALVVQGAGRSAPAPSPVEADVLRLAGSDQPEDVGPWLAGWCQQAGDPPWAVLLPSTPWGREVAARAAVRLGAGLIGDAVALSVDGDRLVAWKPAFGGSLLAAVRSRSAVQLVTVRPGVLPAHAPQASGAAAGGAAGEVVVLAPRGRVRELDRRRDDDTEALASAPVVVGVGQGVTPEEYGQLDDLLDVLGAELVATRKVTDRGWMPRARQVGITGLSIAPRLYVAIGTSGRFNHMAGVRSAGAVVGINPDPEAPLFDVADVGLVGDWREVVPVLVARLRSELGR